MIYGKTLVQPREETNPSVSSDGLTNIYNDDLISCDTKTAQLSMKTRFYD